VRSRSPTFPLSLALSLLLLPLALSAQDRPVFPHDRALLRDALCGARRSCRVESVLAAGRDPHGSPLAVVHLSLRRGPPGARECSSYSDRLAVFQAGVVHELRELSRGDVRCLEWQPSTWSYEHGELIFVFGGMGAPPAADTDMRPTRTHFRPWPLAITAQYHGEDPVTPLPALRGHGPIFILSMDDFRAPG
jgi:hypothetical protein